MADAGKAAPGVGALPVVAEAALLALVNVWGEERAGGEESERAGERERACALGPGRRSPPLPKAAPVWVSWAFWCL